MSKWCLNDVEHYCTQTIHVTTTINTISRVKFLDANG
jgi:hypothetical protein